MDFDSKNLNTPCMCVGLCVCGNNMNVWLCVRMLCVQALACDLSPRLADQLSLILPLRAL